MVAVEFFCHRLRPRGRVVTDTLIRSLILVFFVLLTWYLARYGSDLKRSGQVTMTIAVPIFWLPYLMSFTCAVSALVTFHRLLHPNQPMLKS
jgi:TRAP-type C4-dicarboxylate transport system permease small subunit